MNFKISKDSIETIKMKKQTNKQTNKNKTKKYQVPHIQPKETTIIFVHFILKIENLSLFDLMLKKGNTLYCFK